MKYEIIYADPPWSYNDKGLRGETKKHYDTMTLDDIKALPVSEIAADDCALFLWATYPLYQEALDVIKAWGFRYVGLGFQWIKLYPKSGKPVFGLGRWTRGNTEPCLFARRGKPKRLDASVSQLVLSPRREHSRKPDVVRDKIVQLMGDLPRIELFARQKVEGWDCWGAGVGRIEPLETFEQLRR